jgi:hypothetical protein
MLNFISSYYMEIIAVSAPLVFLVFGLVLMATNPKEELPIGSSTKK